MGRGYWDRGDEEINRNWERRSGSVTDGEL